MSDYFKAYYVSTIGKGSRVYDLGDCRLECRFFRADSPLRDIHNYAKELSDRSDFHDWVLLKSVGVDKPQNVMAYYISTLGKCDTSYDLNTCSIVTRVFPFNTSTDEIDEYAEKLSIADCLTDWISWSVVYSDIFNVSCDD